MTDVDLAVVLDWFDQVSAIPRTSGNEQQISEFIADLAVARGLEVRSDASNNVLIRKSAAPGQEGRPRLALQAHLDMVGEAEPGSQHDFEHDPIVVRRDGDWLFAQGTTLGADDGIGLSLALAIMASEHLAHPGLEFLFTTGEEIGLEGAKALDVGPLEADYLLNIDGEQDGVFLTSCAGGATVEVSCALPRPHARSGAYEVVIEGFRGGHSGLDIDKSRRNAIVEVARLLAALQAKQPVHLGGIWAPGKFNAIAREATVRFWTPSDPAATIEDWRAAVQEAEPDAQISVRRMGIPVDCAAPQPSATVIELLGALPCGVHSHSAALGGLVESSANIGVAEATPDELVITASTRSSDGPAHRGLRQLIEQAAGQANAGIRWYGEYPAWEFDPDNPLLVQAKDIFVGLFGTAPTVTGVHGGLECAVLADKYPHLPMLSVGADLRDCHTPRERASVASIARLVELVVAITERLGR